MIRLFLLLFLPSLGLSQTVIDANQFFKLGQEKFQEYSNAYIPDLNLHWINEYQFRTATRDFRSETQRYSVRLSPTTPRIRKTQKRYFNLLTNAPDFDKIDALSKNNYTIHSDWLTLYFIQENNQIDKELEIILNDKKNLLAKSMGSGTLNPESYIKLQVDINDLEMDKNEINFELQQIKSKYNIQPDSINFSNFITIEDIEKYLDQNALLSNETVLPDLETQYKKDLLTKELDIEVAEKNNFFDFIQLQYTGPHTDLLSERVSLGLGFMLKTAGKNSLKIQQLKLEQQNLDRKSFWDQQEKMSTVKALESKLKTEIASFYLLQKMQKDEKSQLKQLSNNVASAENASPSFFLEIESRNINMKKKLLSKKIDLMEDFLEYLNVTEQFNNPNSTNFLAK